MFDNLDDPQKQMMLALAAGLLSPVRGRGMSGFGESLSNGLRSGLLGYNSARESADRRKQRELAEKIQRMQMADLERGQQFNDALRGGFQPGAPASQTFAPTDMEMPSQFSPAKAPGMDFSRAMQVDPMRAIQAQNAYQQMNAKQEPQYKEVGGRLVAIRPGGDVKEAYAPPEKPHWVDAGDKIIPVGPDGKPVGAPIPKNMAPGEAQRIGMEGARLGMDKARLGMDAGRYNYEIGSGQGLPQKQVDAIAADIGKKQAEAQFQGKQDLPQVEFEAKEITGLVDKLIKHPGFKTSVGMKGPTGAMAAMGVPIPGTDAADFVALRNQIVGKQFMQAFQTLKGGGQITEREGEKATEAMARMSTAQSEAEFIRGANEFKAVVAAGLERQRKRAGTTGGWGIQRVQ